MKLFAGWDTGAKERRQIGEEFSDEPGIVLVPENCDTMHGSLHIDYDVSRGVWTIRVVDGTMLVEPSGSNSIRLASLRRGL